MSVSEAREPENLYGKSEGSGDSLTVVFGVVSW